MILFYYFYSDDVGDVRWQLLLLSSVLQVRTRHPSNCYVCGLMQCTVTSKIQYIVISVQLLVLTESQLIHQFIYSNYRYLKTYLFESVSGLW